jgi:hypothetical protein
MSKTDRWEMVAGMDSPVFRGRGLGREAILMEGVDTGQLRHILESYLKALASVAPSSTPAASEPMINIAGFWRDNRSYLIVFPRRANGSLVTDDTGKVVGSELLAQSFSGPAYFHPCPSAAGEKGYDPLASGGSNLGPISKKLRDQAAVNLEALTNENPEASGPPPVELVTASGSGLDPHLSPGGRCGRLRGSRRRAGSSPPVSSRSSRISPRGGTWGSLVSPASTSST